MSFLNRFTKPKATLSLGLAKHQLFFGDELKGIINLKSQENFDVEEISVSLDSVETVKKARRYQEIVEVDNDENTLKPMEKTVWREDEEEYTDCATLYSDHSRLCGSIPAIVGLDIDFPFVFRMPLVGRETYYSVNSSVRWSLGAFMNVRGRKAIHSQVCEILVAKPTVSTTATEGVIREVVLIPCSHCSGLMPQSSVFCPNCGARRKG